VTRRPVLTLRLRLTLLYGGLLAVVAATLLVVALVVLDRAVRSLPRFPPGVRLQFGDGSSLTSEQFSQLVRDSARSELLRSAGLVFAVVAVVGVAAAYVLAGRALQPVSRVTSTARRLSDETLDQRIALDGPADELKELADTFDAMLARLDAAFDSQRRFVANASHELRTPLTINRTLIEVALANPRADEPLRQLGANLLAVNQRHERLIDGLLTLASGEQGIIDPARVDLADVARHLTAEFRRTAHSGEIDIKTHLEPAPVAGDPVLLERLVQNLLDNAVRYNLPQRGQVTVTTGTTAEGVYLTLENTGPAVPPYEIPSLFEPFRRMPTTERRADPAITSIPRGAGLGLSIVRAVARAHGGDVQAMPRADGGLIAQVRLPEARIDVPSS
jgi:signal transduction histidine kinase